MKQLDMYGSDVKESMKLPDGSNLLINTMEEVLHNSMLPYAQYVIMDRAIPRVEDGLKPVQRRILYSMYELGVTPDKPYRKSARIVGDCLGKYHPHGDSSVYDAMVRMAQSFSMNVPLIDGQGNFGSMDGDSAAAMRYTEAKLSPVAIELLKDIEKGTVRWSRNFDDTTKEPDMLPGRFPNLLVNGATGIAVGLATNIPPHNLTETIDGVIAYIDNHSISLKSMMKIIKGPDFPTGGYVIAGEGLRQAYETGKGKIYIRAKIHIENLPNDRKNIVITDVPYQVNKADLLVKIANLRDDKKEQLAGIAEIVDESDKDGIRAVIKVRKDCDPKKILDILFKCTALESTFGINMVAIADGRPQLMGLLDIIAYYTNYQRELIVKRSKFELEEARERQHILQGLVIAVTNIDQVIAIIKKSSSSADAKQNLRVTFNLSDRQAQAILDLRLARLTKLEITKLEEELRQIEALVLTLTKIIGNKVEQFRVLKEELTAIKRNYKIPRRSEIVDDVCDALIPSEDDEKPIENKIIGLAFDGTIKCIPVKNFNMSDKSATDRSSLAEIHSRLIDVMSNHTVIFFTNKGNCYQTLVSDIPETKYRDGGTKLSDIFKMAIEGEVAVSAFAFGESMPDGEVIIFTRQGMAKRSSWDEYDLLKSSFQGYKCKDDDEVIAVEQVLPDSTALYVTSKGMCINYNVSEVPVQGRVAGGVKGMALDEGDFVVSAHQISNEGEVVVVTDKCYLKRILTCDIPIVTRYRKGVKILDFGASNGSAVIYADYVTIPYDIALIDPASTLVINTEDINIENRNGKGKAPKQRKNGGKLVAVYHYKIAPDLVYRDVKDKRKRRATAITDTDITTATAVKSSAKPKKAIVNNSDEQQTIIVKPDTVD